MDSTIFFKIWYWLKGFFSRKSDQNHSNISNFNAIGSTVNITQSIITPDEEQGLVEEEKMVTFQYPESSGIAAQVHEEGYEISWPTRERVPGLKAEGYEIVYEIDEPNKRRYILVIKNQRHNKDLILMKK